MTSANANFQIGTNGPLSPAAIERLEAIKAKTGMSYASLGQKLGLSGTFVYNLMNKGMNVGTQHVARMEKALGLLEEGKDPEPAEAVAAKTPTLAHSFHLREDFKAEISLPADLTGREAERLALFIKSLPAD